MFETASLRSAMVEVLQVDESHWLATSEKAGTTGAGQLSS